MEAGVSTRQDKKPSDWPVAQVVQSETTGPMTTPTDEQAIERVANAIAYEDPNVKRIGPVANVSPLHEAQAKAAIAEMQAIEREKPRGGPNPLVQECMSAQQAPNSEIPQGTGRG